MADSDSSAPQILMEPRETLSLPKIMFFEFGIVSALPSRSGWDEKALTRLVLPIAEAQLLLVALRKEVDQISHLRGGDSLESLFSSNLVCYMDDKACFSPYSTTSTVVGINRLATTATAAAASGASTVAPALDGIALDGFISRRGPSFTVQGLTRVDVSLCVHFQHRL